jgi:hypothetical protein
MIKRKIENFRGRIIAGPLLRAKSNDALPRGNRTAAIKIVRSGIDQTIDGAALFQCLGAGQCLDISRPEFRGIDDGEREQLGPRSGREFRRGLDRAQCRVRTVIGNRMRSTAAS